MQSACSNRSARWRSPREAERAARERVAQPCVAPTEPISHRSEPPDRADTATIAEPSSSDTIDATTADRLIAVNLRGPLLVTREALPLLRAAGAEHGKALVVNLASVAGKHGQPGNTVYSATKAGLISMTQSLQREVASAGIQATALCPGYVATAMTASDVPPEQMIRPEDIAEAVRFLLRTSPCCLVPEIVLSRRGAIA